MDPNHKKPVFIKRRNLDIGNDAQKDSHCDNTQGAESHATEKMQVKPKDNW